jgi:hypothetical protein
VDVGHEYYLVDAQDVKPGMKVVRLEGHMPGEAGYPLHL